MKLFLALLALLLPAAAFAQGSPDKLPPANPLPYEDSDAASVLAPVNALFAALAARDGDAILRVTDPAGVATALVEGADGSRTVSHSSWADFAERIKAAPAGLEERISDPAIEIDGDIAMVWAPYVFRVAGKVTHCGFDHFDLIRVEGHWRILNISWTKRTTGCLER